MAFLLDTNVVSEARKPGRNRGVGEWIIATPPYEQHLSVVSVGEIERGITRVRERGDHRQVEVIESWLVDIIETFGDRIVPVTLEIAKAWGGRSGRRPVSTPDALIAATAQVHGWTVVTRNVKDFEWIGVRVLNPFSD